MPIKGDPPNLSWRHELALWVLAAILAFIDAAYRCGVWAW